MYSGIYNRLKQFMYEVSCASNRIDNFPLYAEACSFSFLLYYIIYYIYKQNKRVK